VVNVSVLIYPVSFVLGDGPPRLVALCNGDQTVLSRPAVGDVDATARSLLVEVLEDLASDPDAETAQATHVDLVPLCTAFIRLAGTRREGDSVQIVYTSTMPVPLAETVLNVLDGSAYGWRTINSSRGRRRPRSTPEERHGVDAMVLDYWRQTLEETDMALDFLPEYLSLHQLRSLYDAVWGYPQDSSGFKRWAIDRTGALRRFLDDVEDPAEVESAFFTSLGDRLPAADSARAGALIETDLAQARKAGLALPLAVSAAVTANRLVRHRGPEPAWFKKSAAWLPGPTWIENVYPPRPAWTRWDTRQGRTR
jgi:hypothetical protein